MTKPWLDNKDWGRVQRSDARRTMWMMWGFTVLWLGLCSPILFVTPGNGAVEKPLFYVVYLFPLIGVFLAFQAISVTRQWRRFGVTELTLDPYPGAIGGQVGGYVTVESRVTSGRTFTTNLQCVRSYVSGSGKNRSRREKIRWQGEGPAELRSSGNQVRIEFCFDVPDGLPMSEEKDSDHHFWRLSLVGRGRDAEFDRTFNLPVFPTGERARYIATDTLALGRAAADRFIDDALVDPAARAELKKRNGLTVEVRDQWIRLFFHYGRHKGAASLLFLIGAVFAAVGVYIPDDDFMAVVFRGIFGLAGLAMLVGALYLPFNTLDVRITHGQIARIRTWFGIVVARQEVDASVISSLDIEEGASSSSGNKTTVFYRLIAKGSAGDVRVAEGITNRQFIDALRERVMRFAGLEQSG